MDAKQALTCSTSIQPWKASRECLVASTTEGGEDCFRVPIVRIIVFGRGRFNLRQICADYRAGLKVEGFGFGVGDWGFRFVGVVGYRLSKLIYRF